MILEAVEPARERTRTRNTYMRAVLINRDLSSLVPALLLSSVMALRGKTGTEMAGTDFTF